MIDPASFIRTPATQLASTAKAKASSRKTKPRPSEANPLFYVIRQSETGDDHLNGKYQGNGNQDSHGYREAPLGCIAVCCDGCGSSPDSSTGSRAAVRMILNICEEMLTNAPIPTPEKFAATLEKELLHRIWQIAWLIARDDDSVDEILFQSCLFTIVLGIVTPEWTAVFSCGDGFWALNGEANELLPRKGNEPEYLAYLKYSKIPPGFENIGITVIETIPTEELSHLMLATDGITPIANQKKDGFEIADLWKYKKYYKNPTAAKKKIVEISSEVVTLVSEDSGKKKSPKLKFRRKFPDFYDDLTYVILVRNPEVNIPKSWSDVLKQ